MKVSYNWLQSLIKQKLPQPKELADLLTAHSFETKAVGKSGNDYLLEAEVSPNRAHDCLSHLGVAREIAAILGYQLHLSLRGESLPEAGERRGNLNLVANREFERLLRGVYTERSECTRNDKEGVRNGNIKNFLKVEVKDNKLCPRYAARALTEVKVADSPQWLKERLEVCGLRPINNVVDIANYVMLETGQPLHAFDADKLSPSNFTPSTGSGDKAYSASRKTIIVRQAKKGENLVSLDNEKYDLDEEILVIADAEKPVCIAGIKGGKNPEVGQQTQNIILEAANFDYQTIRKASKKLKLRTDASWRFENQLDPNLAEEAINLAAYLIQELAGGKVMKGIVDVYPKKVKPKKIKLELSKINSLLGVNLSVKQVSDIFKRLGFKFQVSGSKFQAEISTYRLDISIPEDLIEEIGRLYGYEKIPSCLPKAELAPTEKNQEMFFQNKFREILVGLGFSEVYNYSFVGEAETGLYQKKLALAELLNPISQEQKYLRPCLILNLLKNVKDNKRYFQEIRMFEIGNVFEAGKEEKRLAAIISLAESGSEFYCLKGTLDALLNRIGIINQQYGKAAERAAPDFCHSLRKAEIKAGNEAIGWLAEIDRQVLVKLGIKNRVAAFELDFDGLVKIAQEEKNYQAPSKYPALARDIAALVGERTRASEVFDLIKQAAGGLLKEIDLFDIYQGENIPAGKKNFAFHLVFQSDERTLTDKEADEIQDKIIRTLEGKSWEVRKK